MYHCYSSFVFLCFFLLEWTIYRGLEKFSSGESAFFATLSRIREPIVDLSGLRSRRHSNHINWNMWPFKYRQMKQVSGYGRDRKKSPKIQLIMAFPMGFKRLNMLSNSYIFRHTQVCLLLSHLPSPRDRTNMLPNSSWPWRPRVSSAKSLRRYLDS